MRRELLTQSSLFIFLQSPLRSLKYPLILDYIKRIQGVFVEVSKAGFN